MSKGGWVQAKDIVQLRRFKEVGVLEVTLMRIIKDDPARFQHVEDKYGEEWIRATCKHDIPGYEKVNIADTSGRALRRLK